MSIIRGKRPDSGFTILSNGVIRDQRLSYRALGILANILSRPDNWTTNFRNLAEGDGREGEAAVRTALNELEKTGYLVRRRARDAKGRWKWDQIVYDSPQAAQESFDADFTDIVAGQSMSQESACGSPRVETCDSQEETNNKYLEEDEEDRPVLRTGAPKPNGFTDWRAEDLSLFREAVGGETVTSDGTEWTEGTFPVDAYYEALRKRKRNPIKWPGKYFTRMEDNLGVAHFLMAEGIEVD